MDFRGIIKREQEAYGKQNLSEYQRGVVEGIEYVADEVIDTFAANMGYDVDECVTLGKIYNEVAQDVLCYLRELLEAEAAEHQVAFVEANDNEKEGN